MVVDGDDGDKVTQTECPSCHRLFCAQCEVPWHAGRRCKETKKKTKNSDKEDALLIDLAKQKQWRRCPNCKFYVERSLGCLHIKRRSVRIFKGSVIVNFVFLMLL